MYANHFCFNLLTHKILNVLICVRLWDRKQRLAERPRTNREEKVATLLTLCLRCYRARTSFWLRFAWCFLLSVALLCTPHNFDYMAISVIFMRPCLCLTNGCVCIVVSSLLLEFLFTCSVFFLSFQRFVISNAVCLCYQIVKS